MDRLWWLNMSIAERGSDSGAASLLAQLRRHYRLHFPEPRRERLFLASVGFGAGAVAVRTVTHMIRHGIGPFRNMSIGGRHLHHGRPRLTELRRWARDGILTLVYAARDTEHNDAVVLAEVLRRQLPKAREQRDRHPPARF
jgi:hypothetical protein